MKRHLSVAAVACAVALTATACMGGGGSKQSGSSDPGQGATPSAKPPAATLNIALPKGWAKLPDQQKDSYHLVVSGKCSDDGGGQISGCHSVQVLGQSYVTPDPNDQNAPPVQPFAITAPHAAQYVQDAGYECPLKSSQRAGNVSQGAKLTEQGTAKVAGETAQYREWEIPCWTEDPNSGQPIKKSGLTYTERDWYLASRRILIVDEWKTPGLTSLLEKATLS